MVKRKRIGQNVEVSFSKNEIPGLLKRTKKHAKRFRESFLYMEK